MAMDFRLRLRDSVSGTSPLWKVRDKDYYATGQKIGRLDAIAFDLTQH
jgi:hypothetical protein